MFCRSRDAPSVKISYFYARIWAIFSWRSTKFDVEFSNRARMVKIEVINTAYPPNESLDTTWQLSNVFRAVSIDPAVKNKYIGRSADPAGKSADIKNYGICAKFGYWNSFEITFCIPKIFFRCMAIFLVAVKFKNCIFSRFLLKNWNLEQFSAFSFTPVELAPPESNSPNFNDYFLYWSYPNLERSRPLSEPRVKFYIRSSSMCLDSWKQSSCITLWVYSH